MCLCVHSYYAVQRLLKLSRQQHPQNAGCGVIVRNVHSSVMEAHDHSGRGLYQTTAIFCWTTYLHRICHSCVVLTVPKMQSAELAAAAPVCAAAPAPSIMLTI